jgi:hypothetical protein
METRRGDRRDDNNYYRKIRVLPNILETELMTVLKTKKEDQIVYLNSDITKE